MVKTQWKYLDEHHLHTLMYVYDSWKGIAQDDIINLDDEYWHVELLVDHIGQQLNCSNMENPYPMYPCNPFTRKPFSVKALGILKKRLQSTNKMVDVAVKALLGQTSYMLRKCLTESQRMARNGHSPKLLDILSRDLRYQMSPEKNSQDLFTGCWIPKNTPADAFEDLYALWRDMPYQMFNNGRIYDNYHKHKLKEILNTKFANMNRHRIVEHFNSV